VPEGSDLNCILQHAAELVRKPALRVVARNSGSARTPAEIWRLESKVRG
jgi:hypothetical protein